MRTFFFLFFFFVLDFIIVRFFRFLRRELISEGFYVAFGALPFFYCPGVEVSSLSTSALPLKSMCPRLRSLVCFLLGDLNFLLFVLYFLCVILFSRSFFPVFLYLCRGPLGVSKSFRTTSARRPLVSRPSVIFFMATFPLLF